MFALLEKGFKWNICHLFNAGTRKCFKFTYVVFILVTFGSFSHYVFSKRDKSEIAKSQNPTHNCLKEIRKNHTQKKSKNFTLLMPKIVNERRMNLRRTLYIFPDGEANCAYQYNFLCKFWFFVRCHLLSSFQNVTVLPREDPMPHFVANVKPGDIVLMMFREFRERKVPLHFKELWIWRSTNFHIPIGFFHVADEKRRKDWTGYARADFVFRNYWVDNIPKHVMFVPLGGQVHHSCSSHILQRSKQGDDCACKSLRLKQSSKRIYLWSFYGSLRRNRVAMVEKLRNDTNLFNRGVMNISEIPFGTGDYASTGRLNPKYTMISTITESSFVLCPCGNVMETHRIYEALMHGAIPIIEDCEPLKDSFFPFRELLVRDINGMLDFLKNYQNDNVGMDRLQVRSRTWWSSYTTALAENVSITVNNRVPPSQRQSLMLSGH